MTTSLSLRIGDAERDAAAARLAEHFAAGRLDETEYQDRLTSALATRTEADLLALFADLPPLPEKPATRATRKPVLFGALLAAAVALLFALAAFGRAGGSSSVATPRPGPAGPMSAVPGQGGSPHPLALTDPRTVAVIAVVALVACLAACVAALWLTRRHWSLHRRCSPSR